jgi:hypothetical protein
MKKIYAIILSFGLILAPVHHAKAEMSWGGIPNMVMGITIGVSGTSIIMLCSGAGMQPSLWAYMAGSIGYVVSEFAGGNALQAHIKAQAVDVEDLKKKAKNGELQLAALQTQLDNTNTQLDYVQKRKGWMYAIGAFFLIATTLAIIELTRETTLGVPSTAFCTRLKEAAWWNTGLRLLFAGAFMGASVKSSGAIDTDSAWGIGGGVLATLSPLLFLIEPVGKAMDVAMAWMVEHASGRIATFGAFSLLTTSIIVDLELIQSTLEQNAEDIQNVINEQFPTTLTEIDTGPGPESVGGPISPTGKGGSIKKLDGFYAIAPVPCASNSGGSFSMNTSNCKNPMKVKRPDLTGNFSNSFLQSAASLAGDYTDAVSAGNMGRAEVLGGKLANMAGRLKLERDNALKNYNKVAKEKKKKLIDFDKEVKAMTASMSANLSKSLASQGIDPKSMMKASTGGDKKPLAAVSTGATPVAAAPVVPLEDLGTTTQTPVEETVAAPAPTLEQSLQEFESNESDISPQKQVSIFKQVSNRYILNYNRFFREEEPTPVATPVEVKVPVPEKAVTQPAR